MSQKCGYSSKQFLVWFFANILGFGALGVSILVFPSILGISGFFITTFIIAIPISLAQWIALRRTLQTSMLWILTIPIGIPLSFLILRVIPAGLWFDADDDSLVAMTSMLLVVGLIIGLLQWIILRRQLVRAAIWLLGSAIGVAGSFWVISVTGLIDQSGIISYIIIALVYSSVTGLFLSGLLAYNDQSQPSLANAT
jgi:hypothetical protein